MPNGEALLAVILGILALVVSVGVFFSFAAVRRRLMVIQGRDQEGTILEAAYDRVGFLPVGKA